MEQTCDAPVPQDVKPPEIEYVAPAPAVTRKRRQIKRAASAPAPANADVACTAPDPGIGYMLPAPGGICAAPTPGIDNVSPAPAVTLAASAPVTAPVPVIKYVAPVTLCASTSPASAYAAPVPVTGPVAPVTGSMSPAAADAAPDPVLEYVRSALAEPIPVDEHMSEEQLTTAVAALRQRETVLQSLLEAEASRPRRKKKRPSMRPRRPNARSVDMMREGQRFGVWASA